MAYWTLEPFCEQRGDIRNAMLMALISNMMRGKSEAAVKPIDFMPFLDKEDQTPEQMLAVLMSAGNVQVIEGS